MTTWLATILIASVTLSGFAGYVFADIAPGIESTAQADQLVHERALAFAEALSSGQRDQLFQPYSLANAARWHNQPQWSLGSRARIGLRLETLSPPQWAALEALLQAATGTGRSEGYDELQQHLAIDDFLHENRNPDYGRGDFLIAFLGAPTETGIWQLQFGGQHFALTHTYRDGALVGATPSFRGISTSGPIQYNGTVLVPQRQEMDAFVALIASLSPGQRSRAQLPRTFRDILMGAGNDWIFPTERQGLAAAELDEMQRALLMNAIALYVRDIDGANAATILTGYERELAETHVSFSGSGELALAGDYVRIDGPSVWIELIMDTPYNFPDPHPHSVWRDRNDDYGGTRE